MKAESYRTGEGFLVPVLEQQLKSVLEVVPPAYSIPKAYYRSSTLFFWITIEVAFSFIPPIAFQVKTICYVKNSPQFSCQLF